MERSLTTRRPALRIAFVLGAAALVLGACASQDADRGDVVNAVEEAGGSRAVANCIADAFVDEFDQDQLNDLAGADTTDDFPDDIRDEAVSIMETCQETGGDSSGSESSETTESTEATDGEESTTTTAAS